MPTDADTSSSITHELHCVSCGYDLRGLDVDSNCPECAMDVQQSLHGDDLRYADAKWLNTIVRGMRLCAFGCAAIIVSILGFYIAFAIFGIVVSSTVFPITDPVEDAIGWWLQRTMQASLFLAMISCALGALLFTRDEPRQAEQKDPTAYSNLVRYGLGCSFALAVGAFAFISIGSSSITRSIGGICIFLVSLTAFIAANASFKQLCDLARRSGDSALGKRWSDLKYSLWFALPGFGIAMSGRVIVGAIGAIPQWFENLLIFAFVVFSVWLLVIAARSGTALNKLRKHIEEIRHDTQHSTMLKSSNDTLQDTQNDNTRQ